MSRKFKYGVIGSTGRLGSEVISLFNETGHKLVFEYSIEGEKKFDEPEVVVDCSLPGVFQNTMTYVSSFNVPLVIATTGLSEDQLISLKNLSKLIPVVQSYNFSIGIQVLLKLTEQAKEIIGDWDIEVTEVHHRFKKDKPSGTAKMIKDIFAGKDINISSLRLGNVPGDHTVKFGGLGEVISISHRALSRRTFAEGILKSAEFIINQPNGYYSFTDVLFGKNDKQLQ